MMIGNGLLVRSVFLRGHSHIKSSYGLNQIDATGCEWVGTSSSLTLRFDI